MNTLSDYLANDLKLLSIGLNPSLPSVKAGFYFANPRNRFWKALNASLLVDEVLEPGQSSVERMLTIHRIGFTDIVKRPTRGAQDLRAADYKLDAPKLKDKILNFQPQVAWFHGKLAYQYFLRYAENLKSEIPWGLQEHSIGSTRVFVTPNPSPANAVFSLADIIDSYNSLQQFVNKATE